MTRAVRPLPRLRWLPSRAAIAVLVTLCLLATLALAVRLDTSSITLFFSITGTAALAFAVADAWATQRAWRAQPLQAKRRLPHALALGVAQALPVHLVNPGPHLWQGQAFDDVDPHLAFTGWPQPVRLGRAAQVWLHASVTPQRRGQAHFGPLQLLLRSRGGCFDVLRAVGPAQHLPVLPNFAAVAHLAWLASDRRLAEAGIKTGVRRGAGTDFRQLADYRRGDDLRHIDWKATLRHQRPIVREFQDDRDQCVLFLLDCGRRMRADEAALHAGASHFDQALNALVLLAYVALKAGDAVGAMTFGAEPAWQRRLAPRKGLATLDNLMNHLHDVQPGLAHADFRDAASQLMQHQHKRALVVVLTNFRGEDVAELGPALRLLRTRHLVLLASLRESALGELRDQTLHSADDVVASAGAHLFEQERADAFARLAAGDPLLMDVEPAGLPAALVTRYLQAKRSQRL